ncbi:MAG: hypothetical protein N2C12_04285, partial [Planctomycetales bacterium]
LVKQGYSDTDIASQLLQCAERYLKEKGAEQIYAAGVGAICPFYLGLYGGSDLPGIIESDTRRRLFFEEHGYAEVDRALLYRRDLIGFRPTLDRALLQIRRTSTVIFITDPPSRSWWDACNQGCFHQIRADLLPIGGGQPTATAVFWDMESLVDPETRSRTTGLCNLKVDTNEPKSEMPRYLLSEALRHLQSQGFVSVQGFAMQSDSATIDLLKSVGFEQFGSGAVLRK